MFKVNDGNTKTIYKTTSKLTIKAPERRHYFLRFSDVYGGNINDSYDSVFPNFKNFAVSQQKTNINSFAAVRSLISLSAAIYLFRVSNGNTRTICEICSKLTIKTPERRRVFMVNLKQIYHIVLVFPLLTLIK